MSATDRQPSQARQLLDLVKSAGTRGVSATEAADALDLSAGDLAGLVRRMLVAQRGYLDSESERLFSTEPFH